MSVSLTSLTRSASRFPMRHNARLLFIAGEWTVVKSKMYIPTDYKREDWESKDALIKAYPLATVITTDENGKIIANHFPFYLYECKETGKKFLHAHVAKRNHQVPTLKSNENVLVIFESHDSYISPSYYPEKQKTHKFVPTWDFASLHIYGKLRIVDDFDFVRTQLENFTNQQESKRAEPWKLTEAPENYLKIMQKAITGLEIEIVETECKYKFEQKMGRDNIDGVVNGLKEDSVHEVAQFVESANKD